MRILAPWPVLMAAVPWLAYGAPQGHTPAELVGVWRGTSTCTDRVAAPACRDEVAIYEFSVGADPATVHWKADKVVGGKRQPMGESDLAYDSGEACWRTEFANAGGRVVWCLVAADDHLTGTAWLLPGKQVVRKAELRKQ